MALAIVVEAKLLFSGLDGQTLPVLSSSMWLLMCRAISLGDEAAKS